MMPLAVKNMNDITISIFGTTVVLTAAFSYLLSNLDALEKLIKYLLKVVSILIPLKKLRNKYTSVSLQSEINSFCETIEKKAPGVMPAALKIQFVNEEGVKTLLSQDGKTVLLRINYEQDKCKMLAAASYHYISKAFLHRPKNYLEEAVKKSVDIVVTKEILKKSGAISSFIEEFVDVEVAANPQIRNVCHKIEYIDEDGFFYEVFVRVMLKVSNQLFPRFGDPEILNETKEFLEFLYAIASKGQKKKVPLSFIGKQIKVSIILVKEEETYTKYGEGAYVNRFVQCMDEGVEIVFIKGIDEQAIDLVKSIVKKLTRRSLISYKQEIYRPLRVGKRGYKRAIYVYALPDKSTYEYEKTKNEEELKKLLTKHVHQISSGEVDVLQVARVKGVLSKVLLKASNHRDNPRTLCLGENGANLKKLKHDLDQENIEFINFNDNIGAMIRECIFLRYRKLLYCKAVNVDGFNKYEVFVPSREAMNYALNDDALHKRLCEKLLNIQIYIQIDTTLSERNRSNQINS